MADTIVVETTTVARAMRDLARVREEIGKVIVGQTDVIETRCGWENATDNPVSWGEHTTDEMCFAFLGYYPVVQDPAWNWAVPAASHATVCK